MRKVILSLGLAIGVVAWAIGLYGLVSRKYDHLLPVPYNVMGFAASAMMGTLLILIVVFAHGTRAGEVD